MFRQNEIAFYFGEAEINLFSFEKNDNTCLYYVSEKIINLSRFSVNNLIFISMYKILNIRICCKWITWQLMW